MAGIWHALIQDAAADMIGSQTLRKSSSDKEVMILGGLVTVQRFVAPI